MNKVVVIAHNIRSAHNVGSLFRTCEGLGISKLYLSGYTPYPKASKDKRLPHISTKITAKISKTALGSHTNLSWEHTDKLEDLITRLKKEGFEIVALEQTDKSIALPEFLPKKDTAILLGNELSGLDSDALNQVDVCVEIPMLGKKESFNVVQATAMALYHIVFLSN